MYFAHFILLIIFIIRSTGPASNHHWVNHKQAAASSDREPYGSSKFRWLDTFGERVRPVTADELLAAH